MVTPLQPDRAKPIQSAGWAGKVALIAKPGGSNTGVGRYVEVLSAELGGAGASVHRLAPTVPLPVKLANALRAWRRVDVSAFMSNYPVWASYVPADIYHITSQNLATLLLFRPPRGRVIVTVHDIIPYLVRHNRQLPSYAHPFHRLFDRLAMQGLKRADLLLADSAWTRETLIQQLGIPGDRIRVVYLGVDTARFRPRAIPDTFWSRYGLDRGNRHLLYVGSEDPRKNLATMLRAFAAISRQLPDLRLVKVGAAHHRTEHDRLVALAEGLGIAAKVYWINQVCEEDLPLFYNAADLYIMSSYYEGFGLPVLEALACGTRVVCSNAASLPEVAGADSRVCAPTVEAIAEATREALASRADANNAAARVAWAQEFSWTRTAAEVCQTYAVACR